jgi:molybdopterin synthase sulfur carrier subunit
MTIEVQFFGQLVDKTEKSSIQLEYISSMVQLKEKLFTLFPLLKESKFVIAINNKMAPENANIPENAKIALMPPFSGG